MLLLFAIFSAVLQFLALGNQSSGNSISFEFFHEEHLYLGSDLEDEEQYPFVDSPNHEDIDVNDSSASHLQMEEQKEAKRRRKRTAEWIPNYDLYGQWAEEYYAHYEEGIDVGQPKKEEPKKDILDKVLDIPMNMTSEELAQEREKKLKRKELIKKAFMILSWITLICIVTCVFRRLFQKFFALCCPWCDPFGYKKKVVKLINAMVPGIYIHKNGRKEFYKPTEEELQALVDVQKILMGVKQI